jgi:hypothetical protein
VLAPSDSDAERVTEVVASAEAEAVRAAVSETEDVCVTLAPSDADTAGDGDAVAAAEAETEVDVELVAETEMDVELEADMVGVGEPLCDGVGDTSAGMVTLGKRASRLLGGASGKAAPLDIPLLFVAADDRYKGTSPATVMLSAS